MTDFKERLSRELQALIPPEARVGAWIMRECQAMDLSTATFRNHLEGENEPLASVWVKYVQRYGKAFEARVLGEAREPMDDLDALQRRIIRDVGELKSRVAERKEGTG